MKLLLTVLCMALGLLPLSAQVNSSEGEAVEEGMLEPFVTWGHTQSYGEGMQFNFRVEENKLRVYFIDADGQLVEEPTVKRINARINKRGDDPEFVPLNFRSDLKAYTSPRYIRKPYHMRVNLIFVGEDGNASNSFQFFLNQKASDGAQAPSAASK